MSEKEKEEQLKFARKLLDTSEGFYVQVGKPTFIMFIDIIAEQQKEIEELKNKKDFFVGTYGDLVKLATAEGTFNYISKDKIKAKIKDLENKLEVIDNGYYSLEEILQGEIKMLQELLKEGE